MTKGGTLTRAARSGVGFDLPSTQYRTFQEFLAKIGPLMGEDGTVIRELHDALGSADHAVQLLNVTASARGRSYSWQGVVVMHTRDGKISEAWIHIRDEYGLDDFLNSRAGT